MTDAQNDPTPNQTPATVLEPARPAYVAPSVATYTDSALLEALGPAQAGGTYTVFGPL